MSCWSTQRVVARLGAVLADALEARARILVERPALRAVIAGRLRAVERTLALAPVEAADVAARERHPHHALAVDVGAAHAEARHRHVVDFRQRGLRRVRSRERSARSRRGCRAATPRSSRRPGSASRRRSRRDALVLRRIERLVGLDVVVALAVAVGVEHERRPALRLRRVAGLVEHLGVEPADHAAPPPLRPQRVVGVVAELQVVRLEAGVDEACTSSSWDRTSRARRSRRSSGNSFADG